MGFKAISIQTKQGRQGIQIPEEMRIDDDKVYLKQLGNSLYIIPYHQPWQNLVDSLDSFTADFMNDWEQPTSQERASFD
jgi:antitoxin VapB